ncbi:MAG: hypothetical protein ACREB8_02075 [Pseudolabrys sp.]
MSKLVRFFAIAALIAGALAMTPGPAAAQRHGGHGGGSWHGGGMRGGSWHGGGMRGGANWHGGGGWRGGGWRGGGWGWGPGVVWGLGVPYYGSYYEDDDGSDCGWVRVRAWRNHHRVWRHVWRCW